MSGQEDLLKRAIEMRKSALKQNRPQKAEPKPEPIPELEEPKEVKVTEVVKEEEALSPQEQVLKHATELRRKALEEEKKKPNREKQKVVEPEPEVEIEPEPEVEPEPVVVKKPKKVAPPPVAEIEVKFKGSLNPSMRAFGPTVRKLLKDHFRRVSVGKDRIVVKNPHTASNADEVSALARKLLEDYGIPVTEVQKMKSSDLGDDVGYRIFF